MPGPVQIALCAERGLWRRLRAAPLWGAALLCTTLFAATGDADRWQALLAAVPALPATPDEALTKVAARRVEGPGFAQLRVDAADTGLRMLQQQADALFEPTSRAAAAQVKARLAEVEQDPELATLSRKIGDTLHLEQDRGKAPSPAELRNLNAEVGRVLGQTAMAQGSAPAAALSDIAAYRLELQRTPPRPGQFLQRLFDLQRSHAQQHAQADREALARVAGAADVGAVTRDLVQRHHALAARQLAAAAAIYAQARETMAPRVAHMAQLARAAELRQASPAECNEAYASMKASVELLLTLQRETVQDVGFWAGTRAAPPSPTTASGMRALYEQSLVPGLDLRVDGVMRTAGPHYPSGRAIVVGLPPGIR